MSSTIAADKQQTTPRRPVHPRHPLSRETSRRLLRCLLARAEAGDNSAAEVLVRLCHEGRVAPTSSE